MLPNFKDATVQCENCGCSLFFVQQMCQITETLKDGKPFQVEEHRPKIALVCKECGAIVREYDAKQILKTGEE